MKPDIQKRLYRGVLIGAIAVACIILLSELVIPPVFTNFEAKTYDWRFHRRVQKLTDQRYGDPLEDIIVVDIDDRSLEKLGRFQQWPRSFHADLVDYLTEGGARAIGFDILFIEPDQDSLVDQRLIAATAHSGRVVHALTFSMADTATFLKPMDAPMAGFDFEKFSSQLPNSTIRELSGFERMDGLADLYNASAAMGFVNFEPDNDGVIRRMPLFARFAGREYPSFALAIIMDMLAANFQQMSFQNGRILIQANEKSLTIPVDRELQMLINYQGAFKTFRYVSYYDVLKKRIPQEQFEGKIILVGTSAEGLSDLRPVPFQNLFPGVEVHAHVIQSILQQKFITKQSAWSAILVLVLIAIIISLPAMVLRPWAGAIIGILICVGYIFSSSTLFVQNAYWIEVVRPVSVLFLSFLLVYIYRYVDEERNKRYLKNMFQFYLTPSVVDELLKYPEKLRLGGERRIATAFFSDIKNFTNVSENLQPEALVAQLNEYLAAMTEIVLRYEGYLDKYEGDAIMAIFGVPVEKPDHAYRACAAALEMQQKLDELRKKWHAEGKPEFYVRIGINSGPMIAGNIGGEKRFDYTVIGDSVNLASRLEGVNKSYETSVIISEFSKELIDDRFVVRELDLIQVKGKNKPVRVYELVAWDKSELSPEKSKILADFSNAIEAYQNKQWNEAKKKFAEILKIDPNDGPANTFIQRCEYFSEHPVPEDWDGVFQMTTK